MSSQNFRALTAALLLGAASVVIAAYPTAAEAAARAAVAKPLQQAVSLANSGNTGAANAKLHEAESVGGLTSGDQAAIEQVRNFIAAKNGSGATGAKGKFANDYNAGRFAQVVGSDADELRKAGQFDGNSELVVAQAYYQMGNYAAAIKILKTMSGDVAQGLLMSAAAKEGDTAAEMAAAEKLILSGQSKYWAYMLAGAEGTHGLTDHELLDIYRLRYLTGNLRNAQDYELLAQLAVEVGSPAEAQAVVQKGMDAKILQGDRDNRLLALAQQQAATSLANQAKVAGKSGDNSVKYGEALAGTGKYPDAVNAIKAGIAKGVTNANDAQIRLGQALLGAGQKDDALKAFASVKGDPKEEVVAHIWSVYVRSGGTATPAAAAGTDTNTPPAKSSKKKK